jgi:hypothetical protein
MGGWVMPSISKESIFVLLGVVVVLLLLFGAIKIDAAKLLVAMVAIAVIVALLNVGDGAGWTLESTEPYVATIVEQTTRSVSSSGESDLNMVQMVFIGILAAILLTVGIAATNKSSN